MATKPNVVILIADDDMDDCHLLREAWYESRLANEVRFVHDGEQLLSYLKNEDKKSFPVPGLILLDLNMPRKDGRESLKEIKSDPELRQIPVVVLTTSQAEEDVFRSYNLGVNSFISKPVAFQALVEIMREIGHYWFEIVELPNFHRK